jgi:ectonucleoside triphosphate diphosphohydrolase 4
MFDCLGIYGWIAVNYVLGKFDHAHKNTPTSKHEPLQTVGALDLGGASAQITFEVKKELSLPPSLTANINLGCDSHNTIHSHHLYVSTLLGYGSNEAFTQYHQSLFDKHRKSPNTTLTISDPCLPLNRQELFKVKGSSRRLFLTGLGNFTACRQEVSKLVNRSTCKIPPCSANGIHQPAIDEKTEFYGVGEYWFTTEMIGWNGRYDMAKYESSAKVRHYIVIV